MIDLTPLEVRQKKGDFSRAFRGYDAELVNDFLDLVADRMEEIVKDNMALRDTVQRLEQEVEAYRHKERALSDALMTAQRLREDARGSAQKEGELMIREARLAAETARQEAVRALAREQEALRQARARRTQMVESFRRLLERELGQLAVIEETLELGDHAPGSDEGRPEGQGAGTPVAAPSEQDGGRDAATQVPTGDRSTGKQQKDRERPLAGPEPEGEGEVQEDWLSSLVEE